MRNYFFLKNFWLLLCCGVLLVSNALAFSTTLNSISYFEAPHKLRIVLNTAEAINYKTFTLANPPRLVIDIQHAKLMAKVPALPANEIANSIRVAQQNGDALRIVLDLSQKVKVDVVMVGGTKIHSPHQLMITLSATQIGKNVANQVAIKQKDNRPQSPLPKAQGVEAAVPLAPVITAPSSNNLRDTVIVIDPGHGGKDPGAIGVSGTREKDVVLAIATYLQQIINAQPGFKAYLTRNSDYFIPLRERLRIERSYHPDMFIAIHADAYDDINATGASIFALSLRGATSEAARWLAQKENESELGAVLANKNMVLRSVLMDLTQSASISSSLVVGQNILRYLDSFTHLHHDFVEQAGFVVLKEPEVPSLLVETGFLSNVTEEQKLRLPEYQQKIADALAAGIINYYKDHRRL